MINYRKEPRQEARRFQKTRTTTAKMGGLYEERSEKGRGGRKTERKGKHATGTKFTKVAVLRSDQ